MGKLFDFNNRRMASYELVEWVIAWLKQRSDVLLVEDLQDNPEFYRIGDVRLQFQGRPIEYMEIKAEVSYTRKTTQNLAVERFSDRDKKVEGGPWNTQAEYYGHVYLDGLLVIMERAELCAWLKPSLSEFRTFHARNKGWVTTGNLVPRSAAKAALASYQEYEVKPSK